MRTEQERKIEGMMDGMTILAMKEMSDDDRNMCVKACMKQIAMKGYIPYDLKDEILRLSIRRSEEQLKAKQELESKGMEVLE